MKELKTLKDFIGNLSEITEDSTDVEYLSKSSLRQEASKWIKELEIREDYQGHKERSGKTDLIHSINWIQHFFNITEEDLKE